MERNRYRHQVGDGARLRLEALEDRALLAVAAFEVNLSYDVGGAPGATIVDDTIARGESFFVEITVREFDPRLAGLAAVALDIAWDPAALAIVEAPFNPAAVITADLPLFQTGTLDATAGTIDNLAGAASLASGSGRPIGDGLHERFALLHFQAVAATSDSPLHISEGRSRIVSVPTATFVAEQFDFDRQLITIAETDDAPADDVIEPARQPAAAPLPPLAELSPTPILAAAAALPASSIVSAAGASHLPRAPQPAAVDVVFETAETEELSSAGTPREIDTAWLQALVTALASDANEEEVASAFGPVRNHIE